MFFHKGWSFGVSVFLVRTALKGAVELPVIGNAMALILRHFDDMTLMRGGLHKPASILEH